MRQPELFFVRVVRRRKTSLLGEIERPGSDLRAPFANASELWQFLLQTPPPVGGARHRKTQPSTTTRRRTS